MIAFDRAEIFSAIRAGSMRHVCGSGSTRTGVAPFALTAMSEAMYVFAGAITSSPGPMPIACTMSLSASSPFAHPIACFTPQ